MMGKLVRYGEKFSDGPLGIVVDSAHEESDYHHRIRVMWIGEKLPVQARAFSTKNSRVTSWVKPGRFTVVTDTKTKTLKDVNVSKSN